MRPCSQILVVMGLLVRVIKWQAALAGLAATLALIPLSIAVGRALASVRKRLIGYTDARVKLCTEVITGGWAGGQLGGGVDGWEGWAAGWPGGWVGRWRGCVSLRVDVG